VALVTGASRGIGRGIAEVFADEGADVAVNYVASANGACAVVEYVKGKGGRAISVQADVSKRGEVEPMIERVWNELGPIDILVNNAGNAGADPSAITGKPFWQSDPTEWEPFIGVNLYGVFHCSRAVIPGMIERDGGGRLITVISDAGRVGEPGLEAYSAAKAGAAGLMRALAKSLGRYEITANSVAIATTNTPAVRRMVENEELAKKVLRNYTIRRFGEPSDVAAMVTFLASSASSWITGQTYPVNGGFSVNL